MTSAAPTPLPYQPSPNRSARRSAASLRSGTQYEEADERTDLVRLALERAEVQAADAVLIGDTPADVAGAHAHGVRAVAVATGRSSERELREAGADLVLPDLCDTEAVVAAVHGWAG